MAAMRTESFILKTRTVNNEWKDGTGLHDLNEASIIESWFATVGVPYNEGSDHDASY